MTRPKHVRRKAIKERIFRKQGGLCCYCGFAIALEAMTLEHLIPRSRGGTSEQHNLALACVPCNQLRGNWLPDDGPLWTEN